MGRRNAEEVPLRDRSISEISGTLRSVLGQRLVAYMITEEDPDKIGAFARSEDSPKIEVEAVLRDLAEVVEIGLGIDDGSADIVRATLIGMNPNLNDFSPAELFHEGRGEEVATAAQSIFDQ